MYYIIWRWTIPINCRYTWNYLTDSKDEGRKGCMGLTLSHWSIDKWTIIIRVWREREQFSRQTIKENIDHQFRSLVGNYNIFFRFITIFHIGSFCLLLRKLYWEHFKLTTFTIEYVLNQRSLHSSILERVINLKIMKYI